MKRLFIALMCCSLAVGASAKNSTPKKENDKATKTVVITYKKSEFKVSTTEIIENAQFRQQKKFQFFDSCGQMMTVWVSGPSSAGWEELGLVAGHYAQGCLDSNGCFS
jgi:hypothetical protein